MGWSLTIGRITGIDVRIHWTFVLFLAWIVLAIEQTGGIKAAMVGLAYVLLLFSCVVAHEFGHILTARRYGIETEDVILLPIGGLARMKRLPERPQEELAVALAGPAVNIAIALVLSLALGAGVFTSGMSLPLQWDALFPRLAAANLILALFNLIPAFPMDGGRALRALLASRFGRVKATDLAVRIGHALAVGMGVSGLLAGYPLLMLIAVFIYLGASAERNDIRLHALAHRMLVADAMITQFRALPGTASIGDATQLLIHSTQGDIPIIDDFGKPVGLATRNAILQSLHDHGPDWPLARVMRDDIIPVAEGDRLDPTLEIMQQHALAAVPVVDRQGKLTGLLTLEKLGQLLAMTRLQAFSSAEDIARPL